MTAQQIVIEDGQSSYANNIRRQELTMNEKIAGQFAESVGEDISGERNVYREDLVKIRNVVNIGIRFYVQSNTIMSSIYLELGAGKYRRYDYGFMNIDKGNGYKINMRDATPEEIEFFDSQLTWLILQR